MLDLISGEAYRILHKKSMYVYFAVFAVLYFVLAFVRSAGFTPESVTSDAISFFTFAPALLGGFLFAALYTDDLNAKNLTTLVGYGVSKTAIVVAKFILATLITGMVFALLPLLHAGIYTLLGQAVTGAMMTTVAAVSFKFFLMTLAFYALAGIVVYGLQRSTFAIVTYVLLSFGIIETLVRAITTILDLDITDYLLSGITDRIMTGLLGAGAGLVAPTLEYLFVIVAALVLSIVIFNNREMEF